MTKHSHVGASSCYRYWECPGSIEMIKKAPPQETSPYAVEGTAAHELCEWSLRLAITPSLIVKEKHMYAEDDQMRYEECGQRRYQYLDRWDFEMGQACDVYYLTVLEDYHKVFDDDNVSAFKKRLHIEHKFHLKHIDETAFGTNDACFGEPFGCLYVYDFKYGKGVPVEAVGNKQGLYYALGAAQLGSYEEVEIVIVQPRCDHKDGPVRRWRISIDELNRFGSELRQKIKATREPNATLKAGDHCRFCAAKGFCPALLKECQAAAQMDFATPVPTSPIDPKDLTNDQIGNILKKIPLVDSWCKAVVENAQHRAEIGQTIPGYKLVKKRSNRRWKDPDMAASQLACITTDLYNKTLKSPAQVEKVLQTILKMPKKNRDMLLAALVEKPDAGVTLAPEDDKREALPPPAQSDFETVNTDLF